MAGIIKVDRVQSDSNLAFQVGSANVAYFDATDGIKVPLVTTNGIKFPSNMIASSDANTLDDYEEGTWTPRWWDWTAQSAVTATYNNDGLTTYSNDSRTLGSYIKIGRQVTVMFDMYVSSISPVAGNTMAISGLPFTSGMGIYQATWNRMMFRSTNAISGTGAPAAWQITGWFEKNTSKYLLAYATDTTAGSGTGLESYVLGSHVTAYSGNGRLTGWGTYFTD